MNFIKLKENKFVKNVLMLAGGTAFAQLLTIALSPIITRLYTPNEYGVLSVYVSILTLLGVGATLNYHRGIPLVKDEKKAFNVVFLSFIVLFLFISLLFSLIFIRGESFLAAMNSSALVDYMYFIPLGVLLLGIYQIFMHWSMRTKNFKTITKTKITQSIFSNGTKIGLGIISLGPAGLLIGHIIGQSGGIIRLAKPLFKQRHDFVKSVSLQIVKIEARKYSQFPIFTTPSGYVYTGGSQLPFIILATIFGPTIVGLYGLANSIVNLPIALIATSISQVFYSEAASLGIGNAKRIKSLSLKLTSKLALAGLIPMLIFIFLGPLLFGLVFGAQWQEAGTYAGVLSIIAYTHFVILPIGRVLEVLNMEKVSLLVHSVRLVFIGLAFYLSFILEFGPLNTLILFAIVSSSSYIVLFVVVQFLLTKQIRINESKEVREN
ncbi:oligosaccharide flippase family protein [Planomicrobium okeanokoites]|uniref:oligosaccharide flippase family protein n=1 Tax=Planomicrobium okeanokoites TaxID=244 RepID=UPI0009FC57BE|nr:oligosaccharide flippase family protein [Planomicrobium okeanokoites]